MLKNLESFLEYLVLAQMEPQTFIAGLKAKILPTLGITSEEIDKAIAERIEAS